MRFDKEVLRFYRTIQNMLTVRKGKSRILIPEYVVLKDVLQDVETSINQINKPLRVAIAGYMKAGKSTLLNAIMKRNTLCTGAKITTYTPTWFRYSDTESMSIVFRDGKIRTGLSLDELERWTSIAMREENPAMKDVSYVIIYSTNEILKTIELIDTPGLFSPEEEDSQRTIDLLGLEGIQSANEQGKAQSSMADAIVYAFSSNFKENDLNAVSAFTTTPVNAVAVFTKLDQSYWDCINHPEKSPIERMAPIIRRNEEKLRSNLYCIRPVVSILVEGFVSMDDYLWDAICSLSSIPLKDLSKWLGSAAVFHRRNLADTTAEQRERLYSLLGKYGVFCVVEAVQNGVSRQEMLDYLYEKSGVKPLVNQLISHFGTRSFIIKTEAVIARIEAKLERLKYTEELSTQVRHVCTEINQEISNIRSLGTFEALGFIRQYYEGKLRFPTEEDNSSFLRILGEYGNSAAIRLGISETASINDLEKAVLPQYIRWCSLANDNAQNRSVSTAAEFVRNEINDLRLHIEMLSSF